jgi:alanyl-tRNA synthetase
VRILNEASIGSGMRRVEALVGPDALREINLERRLLDELTEVLKAGDPRTAPDRARQLMRELKQLQNELGMLHKGDVAARVEGIAGRASTVAGVRLVASVEDGDADALRELAQKVVNKLENEGGAAVVLGSASNGKALIVAAVSKNLVGRGVTAPQLLDDAAAQIGGGAGGKPILGFAGGRKGDAVEAAVASTRGRLEALVAGARA